MSDLVGNPDYCFSRVKAQILRVSEYNCKPNKYFSPLCRVRDILLNTPDLFPSGKPQDDDIDTREQLFGTTFFYR